MIKGAQEVAEMASIRRDKAYVWAGGWKEVEITRWHHRDTEYCMRRNLYELQLYFNFKNNNFFYLI